LTALPFNSPPSFRFFRNVPPNPRQTGRAGTAPPQPLKILTSDACPSGAFPSDQIGFRLGICFKCFSAPDVPPFPPLYFSLFNTIRLKWPVPVYTFPPNPPFPSNSHRPFPLYNKPSLVLLVEHEFPKFCRSFFSSPSPLLPSNPLFKMPPTPPRRAQNSQGTIQGFFSITSTPLFPALFPSDQLPFPLDHAPRAVPLQ